MNTTKLLASIGTAAVITITSGVAQANNSNNGSHISTPTATTQAADSAPHKKAHASWSYTGNAGPTHWSELSDEYSQCGAGDQQSPIDLTNVVDAQVKKLNIDWHTLPDTVTNNGHSIQVNTPEGNYAEIDGQKFELLQFHMHHPSEHTFNGHHFPVELHFVHKSDDGRLGVVGVFMEKGDFNPTFQKILDNMPKSAGKTNAAHGVNVDPTKLLPEDASFFRYEGSLTTPPCSQIVEWAVYDQPIEASQKQIDQFAALYPMNARPTQDKDRRYVLKSH